MIHASGWELVHRDNGKYAKEQIKQLFISVKNQDFIKKKNITTIYDMAVLFA